MSRNSNYEAVKRTFSPFQNFLHSITPEERQEGKQLASIFTPPIDGSTHYYIEPVRLESKVNDSDYNMVTYIPKAVPYHALVSTFILQFIPQVKINPAMKDTHQICWCEDLLLNIFQSLDFEMDNVPLPGIDRLWCISHYQAMVTSAQREVISRQIGNIPELTEWGTFLPQHRISYVLPMFYSKDVTTYFPLFLCGKNNNIVHRLSLQRELSNLIKVREIDRDIDGNIRSSRIIPFSYDYVIVGKSNDTPTSEVLIPIPEMFAEYNTFSEIEYFKNKCDLDEKGCNRYLCDSIRIETKSDVFDLGKTAVIEIPEIGLPVHTIIWMAENEEASEHNIHSNFTTNPNSSDGYSPIEHTSLEVGKIKIFTRLPSQITEYVIPSLHFLSTPEKRGINFYTFNMRCDDTIVPPGVILDKGKLSIKLGSQNPLLPQEEVGQRFRIHAIFVCTNSFRFRSYPQTEEDREKVQAFIQVGDME